MRAYILWAGPESGAVGKFPAAELAPDGERLSLNTPYVQGPMNNATWSSLIKQTYTSCGASRIELAQGTTDPPEDVTRIRRTARCFDGRITLAKQDIVCANIIKAPSTT